AGAQDDDGVVVSVVKHVRWDYSPQRGRRGRRLRPLRPLCGDQLLRATTSVTSSRSVPLHDRTTSSTRWMVAPLASDSRKRSSPHISLCALSASGTPSVYITIASAGERRAEVSAKRASGKRPNTKPSAAISSIVRLP